MRRIIALAGLALSSAALAAPPSPATPVHQFIDAFNKGDTKTGFAAYASGTVAIVDEFAPHLWTGPKAAEAWAADYTKHATATGVTEGIVKYGAPTRIESDGKTAYVIMPTTYLYKEHGKPIAEEAQLASVVVKQGGVWKLRAWTWTGVKPHPAK